MIRVHIVVALFLTALLAGAQAAELPSIFEFGLFKGLDLEDSRLDEENLKPAIDPNLPEAKRKELERLHAIRWHPPIIEPLAVNDPKTSPQVRDAIRRILESYREGLIAHDKKFDAQRKADPLFDAKVQAARIVACDHIGRLSIPHGGGILPPVNCTDPREYEWAHWQAVVTVQTLILKQKYNIDWTPPPRYPDFGPSSMAEIERGIPVEAAAGFIANGQ
jgi:hypothetical protein